MGPSSGREACARAAARATPVDRCSAPRRRRQGAGPLDQRENPPNAALATRRKGRGRRRLLRRRSRAARRHGRCQGGIACRTPGPWLQVARRVLQQTRDGLAIDVPTVQRDDKRGKAFVVRADAGDLPGARRLLLDPAARRDARQARRFAHSVCRLRRCPTKTTRRASLTVGRQRGGRPAVEARPLRRPAVDPVARTRAPWRGGAEGALWNRRRRLVVYCAYLSFSVVGWRGRRYDTLRCCTGCLASARKALARKQQTQATPAAHSRSHHCHFCSAALSNALLHRCDNCLAPSHP